MLSSLLCTSQFLLLILYQLCLTTKTSKHILHSSHSSTQNYAIHTTQCTTQCYRRKQVTVHVVTACHSTDMHTHDCNDCYSLRVLLLRMVNSEWHWMHCAFPVSRYYWVSRHPRQYHYRRSNFRYRTTLKNSLWYAGVSIYRVFTGCGCTWYCSWSSSCDSSFRDRAANRTCKTLFFKEVHLTLSSSFQTTFEAVNRWNTNVLLR